MGQLQAHPHGSNQTTRSYQTNKNQQFYHKKIQHQGLLKLRPVPFKNCIEIQSQLGPLFVQNIQITLKDLLQSRLYTNKLFPKQDVQRLIQNVTYTLAYLQQNKIPYKDISSENIFYDDGVFKLLPNQLIPNSRYNKFLSSYFCTNSNKKNKNQSQTTEKQNKSKQFITLPPQLIIAYRCKQTQVNDFDILDKSNVFCLGLLFLQVTTLLPSYECYDTDTCDIIDQIIGERIQMVKEYYSQQIASIIGNMLDYDYIQRMNLKQLSIFVNRQLNKQTIINQKNQKQQNNKKTKPVITQQTVNTENQIQQNNQSRLTKSGFINKSRLEQNVDEGQSRISKPSFNCSASVVGSTSEKKRNKTNKVYMGGPIPKQQESEQNFMKQERNKVYIKNSNHIQSRRSAVQQNNQIHRRSTNILKQINTFNNTRNTQEQNQLRQTKSKLQNINNMSEKFKPSIPEYSAKSRNKNILNQQQDDIENNQPDYLKTNLKRKNSTDYLGYRASVIKTPKQEYYHQQKSRFQIESQSDFKEYKKPQYNHKSENAFGFIKKDDKRQQIIRQGFCSKQESIAQDSGSRGYFVNQKIASQGHPSSSQFRDQDHSLNRIKSQIQRSRKLIQEFKKGQKCQF